MCLLRDDGYFTIASTCCVRVVRIYISGTVYIVLSSIVFLFLLGAHVSLALAKKREAPPLPRPSNFQVEGASCDSQVKRLFTKIPGDVRRGRLTVVRAGERDL